MDDKVTDEELAQVAGGSGLFRHNMLRAIAKELKEYRRQAQEVPKAVSQSAENLVKMIFSRTVHNKIDEAKQLIEADRAAQRQIGREEAMGAKSYCVGCEPGIRADEREIFGGRRIPADQGHGR